MIRAGVWSSPCDACWISSCSESSKPSDSPPPASSTARRSLSRRSASSRMGSGGSLGSTSEPYSLYGHLPRSCERSPRHPRALSASVSEPLRDRRRAASAPALRRQALALGLRGHSRAPEIFKRREHRVELAVDLRGPRLLWMLVQSL